MMTLKNELKRVLIKGLNLVEVDPDDIQDDDILFGDKFGLDSIDAMEVIYQVKQHFGVAIRDMKEGRPALLSINTLAAFIEKRRAEAQ